MKTLFHQWFLCLMQFAAFTVGIAALDVQARAGEASSQADGSTKIHVPKAWDSQALKGLELPVAGLDKPPELVSPEYYYSIPVRPIYKSYDVYHPNQEPPGYFEWLKQQEPEVVWDGQGRQPKLESTNDWIRSGEIVFAAPVAFDELTPKRLEQLRKAFQTLPYSLTSEGKIPFYRYVVREKGKVEFGGLSCAECHTRVMPGGQVIKGAQGNPPFDRLFAIEIRETDKVERNRRAQRFLFGAPWARQPILEHLDRMTTEEIAREHDMIPPGVMARHGTGAFSPVQIPDIIGVHERRYLDHTGLQRNRVIGDLMRYAALNQGGDLVSHFGDFVPLGTNNFRGLRDPGKLSRYSDEQLYALALYLHSLKPPPNPNLPKTSKENLLVERGKEVFQEEGCAKCHDPKQGYTNNKLVAAPGFLVPEGHPARDDIMRQRIGTDATLAMSTRRGTGLYKVPSLRGVWYRGHFEHNGSCATLEDWFDPRRLRDDYVPTGWKGPYGTKTRAVRGHEFGLDLAEEDRKALIAFLKTL